jgi:hypothetical protein
MRIAAAAVALLAAVAAEGATIAPGDIAGTEAQCLPGNSCVGTPPPPALALYGNAFHGKGVVAFGSVVAFGPNGHLFFSLTTVTELDTALAVVRRFPRPSGGTIALTVAQNGNLLTLSPAGVLTIYSPLGTVVQTIALPFTAGSIFNVTHLDLGPDQCTLFYTDRAQTGRRYDVCALHALPGLAPGPWNAVRAMTDGGYIAARDSTLSVFDAQNQLLRAYTLQVDTIEALAFDSDPRFIIAGTASTLDRIRLADGVRTDSLGGGKIDLAVNGEQRPAAAALAADIPALSPPLLFAIALGLMALAWQRLRA